MSCEFSINYDAPKEVLLNALKAAVNKLKGSLEGDTNNGHFEVNSPIGEFSAQYTLDDTSIQVKIDKKPFFISCNMIENEINKYLSKNSWEEIASKLNNGDFMV